MYSNNLFLASGHSFFLKDYWIDIVDVIPSSSQKGREHVPYFFWGKTPRSSKMNTSTETESWFEIIATFVAMVISTAGLLFLLSALASPAHAGRYDGTSWSAASQNVQVIPWDPARCEICRAENGRPSMTECGSPASMQAGVPYVCYCGGSTWCEAGSAPGTQMVGPGGSVGSFKAQSDDYWTVK